MTLPFDPPVEPMLCAPQDDVPEGAGWLYEPKWDGFRCIVFRDGKSVQLQSRKLQPLERYFPELVERLLRDLPPKCVVDGEIIIPSSKGLDFDALLQRILPAASRIEKLSRETPASFVAFDLLALGDTDLREQPLSRRRATLAGAFESTAEVFTTPQTADPEEARRWFTRFEGAGLDGVVAKRAELPYAPGERVMVKVKHLRTADCVIGGFRKAKAVKGDAVGSVLLGLYDAGGVLHHVGHVSGFDAAARRDVATRLKPLEGGESFGKGRTPGAPSRWSQGRDTSWTSVGPELVMEVAFDHLQGNRFRHAARFVRWRPDMAPRDCTYAQLDPPRRFDREEIVAMARASATPGEGPGAGVRKTVPESAPKREKAASTPARRAASKKGRTAPS